MVKLFLPGYPKAGASISSMTMVNTISPVTMAERIKSVKDLLMMKDNDKCTALHHAVQNNFLEVARFLIVVGSDEGVQRKLLAVKNDRGKTATQIAMEQDFLGFMDFLLDRDLDFALAEALSGDRISVGFWRLLGQKKSSKVPQALLDSVSHKQNINALAYTIQHWPECLECVDHEGKNILHLATKYGHEIVVKFVLGLTSNAQEILNKQDAEGNTPLHVAASGGNSSIIYSLLYDDRVNKLTLNKQGKSALDAINIEINKRRAGVYGLTGRVDEKDLKDRSDFDLLVGALISTLSFTAGITVPGGYFSDGPNHGTAVLHKKISFDVFVISNTIALVLSLSAVFSHFCTRRLIREESIIYQLKIATYCSLGAIFAMMIAFITGSYTVLAGSHWLAVTVCIICCGFFGIAFPAIWRIIKEQRQRRALHVV